MGFKPFKWAKNHPWETAALAATAWFGGPALLAAMEGGGAAAAGAGAATAGSPALLGAGAGGVSLGAEAVAGVGGSALMGMTPEMLAGFGAGGEDFAAQMAGNTIAGAGYVAPGMDPAFLGGNTPLGSPYSGFWDKATARVGDKLKDPKTVMRVGSMLLNSGQPAQQGGPQGAAFEAPQMHSALMSQEQITKKWLLQNDPKTYRRIYGDPQGVA